MSENNTKAYYYVGNAVKAIGNGRIEGYLVPFTSSAQPDLDGEYFNAETELHLKDHPVEGLRVMYQHGLDETLGVKTFGKIIKARIDDVGLWVQAQLDLADEYEKAVYELAESGKLGWSSGALPQSVKVSDDGHIKSWAIIEGSLTPTPAMPFKTIITAKSKLLAEVTEDVTPASDEAKTTSNVQSTVKDKKQMNKEQIMTLLDEIMALLSEDESMMAASEDDLKQVSEEVQKSVSELKPEVITEERIMAMVTESIKTINAKKAQRKQQLADALKASAPATPKSKGFVAHSTPDTIETDTQRIEVGEERQFAHMDALQMAGFVKLARSLNVELPNSHERVLAGKMNRYLDKAVPQDVAYEIKSFIKADETDNTTAATQGGNWVDTAYERIVWERARNRGVLQMFSDGGAMIRDLDARSTVIPTENGDPTVYGIGEPVDVESNTSRPEVVVAATPYTTAVVTLTPGTLGTRVIISAELMEDSIIDALSYGSSRATLALEETMQKLPINADPVVTANTNINLIDGTPGTGLSTPYYIKGQSSIRKYALVTGTDTSLDAGGSLTISLFRQALALFPDEIQDKDMGLFFITNTATGNGILGLPELEANNPTYASVIDGQIKAIYARPFMSTGFLPKANTAGKVSGTGSNNTTGTIVGVYAPYWAIGYRRRITLQTEFDAASQSTTVVGTFRMGVQARGAGASVAVYNVGNS